VQDRLMLSVPAPPRPTSIGITITHREIPVAQDGWVPRRRPPTKETLSDAVSPLRKVLEAVEAGTLEVPTPRDVALFRRLQGVLAGWEEALGEPHQDRHHSL
jgi:hypothetical protein